MSEQPNRKAVDIFQERMDVFDKMANDMYQLISVVGFGTEREDIMVKLRAYIMFKHVKALCEGIEKACNIEMEKISTAAAKIMAATGEEQKRAYGYSFTPDVDVKVNVPADQKSDFLAWMKNHELGRELVKEEVHHKALTKFISGLQATGQPTPPMVTTYDLPVLTVRKLPAPKA